MTIIGMNQSKNAEGGYNTTLHVADDFNAYYQNTEAGRRCAGQKVDTIYVGNFDCSALKVGMCIEIAYDKAISTKNGIYQPIKRIDVISK